MSEPKTVPRSNPLFDWPRKAGKVSDVLQNMESKLRQRRRRRIRTGGAAVVLFAFAVWAVPYFRDTGTIVTPAAHRNSVSLADGSTAELNAHTSLRTDFRYRRRMVKLTQGEAFFSVAKDPAHPFIVETPVGTVRVTGTKFNVRLVANRAVVTLAEGKVAFESESRTSAELHPSEQIDSHLLRPRALTSVELENELAWRTGYLALDGLTLAEAASRFAAYHDKEIEVSVSAASLRLGGSCPLDDLTGFFDFVRESAKVDVLNRGGGSYLIRGR